MQYYIGDLNGDPNPENYPIAKNGKVARSPVFNTNSPIPKAIMPRDPTTLQTQDRKLTNKRYEAIRATTRKASKTLNPKEASQTLDSCEALSQNTSKPPKAPCRNPWNPNKI